MKRLVTLCVVLAAACSSPAPQQSAPPGTPTPRDTAALDTLLRTAVEQKRVPHVAAMIATKDGVVYEHVEGIASDAIYSIASMTKAVTTIAAMQLVEAGKVKLDEPAATYAPELGAVKVLDGGALRPPKTAITVRQLVTHTAGFGYEFMSRDLFGLVGRKKVASIAAGGDGFLKAPLLFDPGARWEYGINTDWLGKIVERVSGQSLEAYFKQHIFDPLGMVDSFFVVPPEKRPRVAKLFHRAKDGSLAEQPPVVPPPGAAAGPVFYSGGGGLSSTARDYLTLTRAVMASGQLGPARILTSESIALMGQNQIADLSIRPFSSVMPDLATDGAALAGDLDKFGLGFALNSKPTAAGRGANTMAWAGIFNTFFWIDREHQLSAVLMTQMLPGLEPGPAKLLEEFDRAVYVWRK
jgi:methyl acetate hydrolase